MKSKLELENYNLFADGSIEVDPSVVTSMILKNVPVEKIFVTHLTDEIQQFNDFSDVKIGIKTSVDIPSLEWTIPDHYKYLDVREYLLNLVSEIEQDNLYEKRLNRLTEEIKLFLQLNLDDVIRIIVFIIDEFKKRNIVWGVGRGSSCSSYILFLIGLHDIDPVLYDIEIKDFLGNNK